MDSSLDHRFLMNNKRLDIKWRNDHMKERMEENATLYAGAVGNLDQ